MRMDKDKDKDKDKTRTRTNILNKRMGTETEKAGNRKKQEPFDI